MMKHNNMRDEDAERAYEKKQRAQADDMDVDFWHWVDALVDRTPAMESIDSPEGDDGYKARYEEAMVLVEDMLQYEAHPTWDYYRKYKARYYKLRDSD